MHLIAFEFVASQAISQCEFFSPTFLRLFRKSFENWFFFRLHFFLCPCSHQIDLADRRDKGENALCCGSILSRHDEYNFSPLISVKMTLLTRIRVAFLGCVRIKSHFTFREASRGRFSARNKELKNVCMQDASDRLHFSIVVATVGERVAIVPLAFIFLFLFCFVTAEFPFRFVSLESFYELTSVDIHFRTRTDAMNCSPRATAKQQNWERWKIQSGKTVFNARPKCLAIERLFGINVMSKRVQEPNEPNSTATRKWETRKDDGNIQTHTPSILLSSVACSRTTILHFRQHQGIIEKCWREKTNAKVYEKKKWKRNRKQRKWMTRESSELEATWYFELHVYYF